MSEQADRGPDTERELNEVLASAPMDSPLMRRVIRAHAAALREDGLPPEQMLVRVKSLIAPALEARRLPHRPSTDKEWLRLRITRWAVESYYGMPGREAESEAGSEDDGATG